ncbi:MAG: hypothetical protein JWN67_2070, partial [Actinomycetia bacterium]|nr:hypothetical protein [Actinomycetes bacterium]
PALYADELVGITATGATPRSVATVQVYWPASTADAITSLVWFDGTSWVPVVGSVVKNTTDDLDGTDSGGRFTVTLSTTSSPSVTALAGTVVAVAVERPTSKDDCKQGGWQRYGIFPNQGQCVSWVNHH